MIKTFFLDGETFINEIPELKDPTLGFDIETLDGSTFLMHVWKRSPELIAKLLDKVNDPEYHLSELTNKQIDKLVRKHRSEL